MGFLSHPIRERSFRWPEGRGRVEMDFMGDHVMLGGRVEVVVLGVQV